MTGIIEKKISLFAKAAVAVFAASFLCLAMIASGCGGGPPDQPEKEKGIAADPVFPDAAYNVLGGDISELAGKSPVLKEIRETGLLVVALRCDRPGMCERNEYGIARGFEVDLMRRLAFFTGAKLNIVDPGGDAPIRGSIPCAKSDSLSGSAPYFYSSESGWLCMESGGDHDFARVIDLVVNNLYETGAYQQLFSNWFVKKDYLKTTGGGPAGDAAQAD